jgi:peptidoglycan/xylan/chitin deacetylase (PgdA/CDA1 family)
VLRKIARHVYLSAMGSFLKITHGVHIMNSHFLGEEANATEKYFDLLKKLQKEIDFINFEEAVEMVSAGKVANGKYMAFSFDDGYEDNLTKVYPVLCEFNVNACIFINPGIVDLDVDEQRKLLKKRHYVVKELMTWEMIKEISDKGFIIGDHTYTHVDLKLLPEDKYDDEIIKSKNKIEEKLKKNVSILPGHMVV